MVTCGIDVGTQSVKVVLYDDEKKKIISQETEKIDLIQKDGGVREQKAEWWINAISSCFSRLPKEIKDKISSIGVSGQQHGFVPLDKDGKVLKNVKLWCDTSSSKECKDLINKVGGEKNYLNEIGLLLLPGYTAGKIIKLIKEEPEIYEKMDTFLLPHDYINFILTGNKVMEHGDASGTGILNTITHTWSKKIISLIAPSLFNKLPKLLGMNERAGFVTKEASKLFSIPENIPVALGGGDNMMAAIGTGSVIDGNVTMSLGTSGTLFASFSRPMIDQDFRLACFSSSHGTWLPLLCTMNCTVASEILREEMKLSVKEFDSIAEKAPLGSEGLVLLPFFNGERIPNLPNGEGVLGGMNALNVKKENIARATLEGVSYEFLLGLDAFKEFGMKIKTITLTGGGAKSPFWRQMIADMTGLNVRVPSFEESAAFGASLLALSFIKKESISKICKDNISYDESKSAKPDKTKTELYKKYYQKWLKYVNAVTPIFS